jgi:uncharacterized protein (DUF1778 family)
MRVAKNQQLQIRVSAAEKAAIQRAAARAGMDMSRYVLSRLLPPLDQTFKELVRALTAKESQRRYVLAELNDFLSALSPQQLAAATSEPPSATPEPYLANYVAAMIETAAHRAGVAPPLWTANIAPLDEPSFGTPLPSLRLHLLLSAPPSFRRRNIFVDSSVGDRV